MSLKPVVSLLALGLLAACGQDVTPPDGGATGGDAARQPVATPAPQVDPSRVDAAPGTHASLIREGGDPGYLADSSGAALYYLQGNTDGSQCDTACQQVWPPVMLGSGEQPVTGPGVQQPAVGSMQTTAGTRQLTYHGHPLYRYGGDRGARTTTGNEVKDQWGQWYLMGVDGQPAPSTSSSSGGTPAGAPGSRGQATGTSQAGQQDQAQPSQATQATSSDR
jgi:predicted lipoprotein with Yx(FWY)xxD motif